MSRAVRYTKEQRERAKLEGRQLATIDLSGPSGGHITIQGVITAAFAREVRKMIDRMARQARDEV